MSLNVLDEFDIPLESRDEIPLRRTYSSRNLMREPHKSLIEFTINCPPSKTMTEEKYNKIICKFRAALQHRPGLTDVLEKQTIRYYFETCKSGKLHLHGCIEVKDHFYVIQGLVKVTTECLLSAIDKRLSLNWENNYYQNFKRYRSPTICLQYSCDPERITQWNTYMLKSQSEKFN